VYWQASDALKFTAGVRYTDDRKSFTPWRSQLLVAGDDYGPSDPVNQHWTEVTRRVGLDWAPDLSFTDDTMLYPFYSQGDKAGGANLPPGRRLLFMGQELTFTHAKPFEPEYVDALEFGVKNTLMGGALTLNGGAFYYD